MLIINCSPRVGGNSDLIETFVSSYLQKKRIECQILRLRDVDMKMPDHCYDCAVGNWCKNIKDDIDGKIIPLVKGHNQWLVITPTVCGHASTLFKIFIDRLAPLYHDDRIKFFHGLSIKAIIHGQVDGSWKILVE